jgi:hypothetical protein
MRDIDGLAVSDKAHSLRPSIYRTTQPIPESEICHPANQPPVRPCQSPETTRMITEERTKKSGGVGK